MIFNLDKGVFMQRQFLTILWLFIFWLILSGHYQFLTISLGLASTIIVTYVSMRMRVIGTGEHQAMLYLKLPIYIIWLVWKIIRANVQVAYRIMHPQLPIEPSYLKIKLAGDKPLLHLIHANSITLTPGTISSVIKDGFIYVHTLSRANARSLLSRQITKKILWLQGENNG